MCFYGVEGTLLQMSIACSLRVTCVQTDMMTTSLVAAWYIVQVWPCTSMVCEG
jgi:hypothetical protein